MKTLNQTYHIKAPLNEVWKALTDPAYINGWGGGPAVMNDKKGTRFSLWGGDIYGKNREVVSQRKLVQDWYGGKWAQASLVTFLLTETNGRTTIELTHEDVPDREAKDIENGWKEYYLGPLKEYVEKK